MFWKRRLDMTCQLADDQVNVTGVHNITHVTNPFVRRPGNGQSPSYGPGFPHHF